MAIQHVFVRKLLVKPTRGLVGLLGLVLGIFASVAFRYSGDPAAPTSQSDIFVLSFVLATPISVGLCLYGIVAEESKLAPMVGIAVQPLIAGGWDFLLLLLQGGMLLFGWGPAAALLILLGFGMFRLLRRRRMQGTPAIRIQ
jgi:hypothetical protein